MPHTQFEQAVEQIVAAEARYAPEAYHFLLQSLKFTRENLGRPERGPEGHVTPRELLEGVKDLALREYGPMAALVLEEWGIKGCEDFGAMVFQLVNAGQFNVTEQDRPEDFCSVFDFTEAFRRPFLPQGKSPAAPLDHS